MIMKKLLSVLLALLLLAGSALAEIPYNRLEGLTEADRTILTFNVNLAIEAKENGDTKEKYSYHLNMDLMDLSLDELLWLFDYLHGNADLPLDREESILSRYGITVTVSDEVFRKDDRLAFCLFSTINQAGRAMEYVTQVNNPEIVLEPDTQRVTSARFYMDCFADGIKDDLRPMIEDYTDALIAVITETYPGLTFDSMMFCWKIPAVDPDSLYTATFWCENGGDGIARGDGSGALYR